MNYWNLKKIDFLYMNILLFVPVLNFIKNDVS